jgi:nucleotide-binding universal stress UspA family protein
MLKNLLVHVPSEAVIRPVVDAAVSLAVARAACLDAVSAGYEVANVGLAVEGGAAAASVLEIERERALTRANAALAVFEAEARNANIAYALRPLTGLPFEVATKVTASARLYDLTIVPQPDSDHDSFDNILPQEILFQSGGPVLFVPHIHKGPFEPRRIGIAWDGSRLAARAVRDAASFLLHADAITIMSINETPEPGTASAVALAEHLARHGLTARIERAHVNHTDIQPALLSIAADASVDLMVMGGYGHSRLQERILGGVTRGMLQSMTVPTLMSH